jgi:hypothetical protein
MDFMSSTTLSESCVCFGLLVGDEDEGQMRDGISAGGPGYIVNFVGEGRRGVAVVGPPSCTTSFLKGRLSGDGRGELKRDS